MNLPAGVIITPLQSHKDHRGIFTEIFRQEWHTQANPIQWNMVASKPKTFRGLHVHLLHHDYFITAQGNMCVGFKDLRKYSPTHNLGTVIETNGDNLLGITIPRGVAHGFYSYTSSLHIYSVSHYWNKADELGCYFADPELDLTWPFNEFSLSDRDTHATSYQNLLKEIEPWQDTLMVDE